MKELKKAFEEELSKGWKMTKMVDSGYSGLFFYKAPRWEEKTVYDIKQLLKYTEEGYLTEDNLGWRSINILLSLATSK